MYLSTLVIAFQCSAHGLLVYLLSLLTAYAKSGLVHVIRYMRLPMILEYSN
ncbi:hypothetical protein HanIR_Chr09g0432411 [Helianthus annuus]|nr:hypothetical protein HanIR_Chr09g0432411 [Helianthus annuus]